ncbi:MAG: redox-regulated ATPase YchF [Verrucomicrobiota bacterium]
MLRAGIVGLPNVGKSTLFNAMTRTRKAESANYPFCTIEPNVGMVMVPDVRLETLAKISDSEKVIPAVIEMMDIAGLVKGASEGEGLGNQFLANIRETDAIVQVVRCFEDADVHHVNGSIDPLRDIEVIMTELILADISSLDKQESRIAKLARMGDQDAGQQMEVLAILKSTLDAGKPALSCDLTDEEQTIAKSFFLLTSSPTLFACNVKEEDLAELEDGKRDSETGKRVAQVEQYCSDHLAAGSVVISAQIESELMELSTEEAAEYLAGIGVGESGVGKLIKSVYHLLGLQTYLTTGRQETRAWTIKQGDKAPQAAGVIHTDFERGFIAAETMSFSDLKALGSQAKVKEAGKLRIEGKEYVVQDGDVIEFRFNV